MKPTHSLTVGLIGSRPCASGKVEHSAVPFINWTTFATALGCCGIAWTKHGIKYFNLPENSANALEVRMKKKFNTTRTIQVPSWVAQLIQEIRDHFDGHVKDFSKVPVVLDGIGPFARKALEATRKIKPGTVTSYGEIARLIHSPEASRAVGRALGSNPVGLIIPCHRVIGANRKIGGFSAYGGANTKKRMLMIEGIDLDG